MASERATDLLRQILAEPDDLATRAIYADELMRHGNPRGEFIALELAGDLARARTLFGQHAATWWPELPARRFATHNGFVERVAGTTAQLDAAARVFASEPIRDVEVIQPTRAWTRVFERARVRRLAMSTWDPATLERIVAEPGAELLEVLDLGAAFALKATPLGAALPRCRELVLAQIPSLGSSLPRILEWDHVDRLEVLDLSRTTLTPEALRDVLARPFGALRELRLSGNPLGPSGAKVLGEALPRLRSLAALEVVSCGFDDATLATRATITSRVPDRIAIDLVGTVIELQRTGETWTVLVDGVPRMVRWQSIARGDDRPDRVTVPWQMAKLAPLDTLAGGLAGGAIRVPSPDGCVVDLGAQMGYVYNTSVYSRETAELAYDPVKLTVSITFAESTSID